MFEVLKNDIHIGDKVRLHLLTGQNPIGFVIEIGDNFLILEEAGKKSRYFEKLIGGWDIPQESTFSVSQDNNPPPINKNFLLETISTLLNELTQDVLNAKIISNANICKVSSDLCFATAGNIRIEIKKQLITDTSLLDAIEKLKIGDFLPVWVLYHKNTTAINPTLSFAIGIKTVKLYLDQIKRSIVAEDYYSTKNLLWQFRELGIYLPSIGLLVNALRPIKTAPNQYLAKKNAHNNSLGYANSNSKTTSVFCFPELVDRCKRLETKINIMMSEFKFDEALSEIDAALNWTELPSKYIGSLLLKRAQIFSSLSLPEKATTAYQKLIEYQESVNAPGNNLSHLYHELARLQAIAPENIDQAINSLKKSLKHNPNNRMAEKLLQSFENNKSQGSEPELNLVTNLTISKMLQVDIEEHRFTSPQILRNNEKPTTDLAKEIWHRAFSSNEPSTYPLYLEAAKAFNELNPGSYDSNLLYKSIAFYSMLKGDSLFLKFKNAIIDKYETINISRLRDSAGSYYLEALNLMTKINPTNLLKISVNYTKLQLGILFVDKQEHAINILNYDFKNFFPFCVSSDNPTVKKIALNAIIEIGSQNNEAWDLLREALGSSLASLNMHKKLFFEKIHEKKQFEHTLKSITKTSFEPNNFDHIHDIWFKVFGNSAGLSHTDLEIKNNIEKLVTIIKPYLGRNDNERTHLLLQAKSIIESQFKFITENTTYYGRTFFYYLLLSWDKSLDKILAEKMAYDLPNLTIEIDPPYYLSSEAEVFAPLTVRNVGKTTAAGYDMQVEFNSPIRNIEYKHLSMKKTIDITNEGKIDATIEIPSHFVSDNTAVEIKISIAAMYQDKKVNQRLFTFTLEKEPQTKLTAADIPWTGGHSTPEHLFKGRQTLIKELTNHYLSEKRSNPYVLYGLTRTGKSSILDYLSREIDGSQIECQGKSLTIRPFGWDLQWISNESKEASFYYHLLEPIFSKWSNFKLNAPNPETFLQLEALSFIDLKKTIFQLNDFGIFPFFVIDEFALMRDLIDKNLISSAFLAALREFSLKNQACFIFAGTYETKELMKHERYGITGQFVHVIDYHVGKIDDTAAESLIQVVDPQKLVFTQTAINHIKLLSGNVPYFIQMICKACGDYAVAKRRRYIGYPELEKVVFSMTSTSVSTIHGITQLTDNFFHGNQFFPKAPLEELVLISSIAYLNRDNLMPVKLSTIKDLWRENDMAEHINKLPKALESLLTKKILYEEDDEGSIGYKLSVDLFRRWWYNRHKDIKFEISKLAGNTLC